MSSNSLHRPVPVDRAMDDFDRYVDSFFSDSPLVLVNRKFGHFPAMDVQESDDAYKVEVELPGFTEKDVDVHIDGRAITVESKQTEESEEKKKSYLLKERRSSSFRRSFTMPDNADYETIQAHFKDGVLTLDIKKLPQSKKRTISITSK